MKNVKKQISELMQKSNKSGAEGIILNKIFELIGEDKKKEVIPNQI